MGKVGQKKTRLRTPVMGFGKMCFWFMAYSSTVTPRRGFHHVMEDDDDAENDDDAASMALARNGGSSDVCVFVFDKSVVEG